MKIDNKRQVEASESLQEQVKENKERIDRNEGSITKVSNELANLSLNVQVQAKVEREVEKNQRRRRERNAAFEQKIKQDQ
jgi:hypothetical protein